MGKQTKTRLLENDENSFHFIEIEINDGSQAHYTCTYIN